MFAYTIGVAGILDHRLKMSTQNDVGQPIASLSYVLDVDYL